MLLLASSVCPLVFSCSVMSDSLRPHGLQHVRLPCPSPSLRACSKSCPLSWWCHKPSLPLSSPSPPAFNLSQQQVLSNELALHIRWLKYWSFSFGISPSNEYSGLLSFRIDWFWSPYSPRDLKSLLQQHSSKASILLFLKFSATFLEIQCFQFFQISRFIILIVSWKSVVIIFF